MVNFCCCECGAMSVIEFEPVYRTDWPLEDEKNRYESYKEWEGNSGFFLLHIM